MIDRDKFIDKKAKAILDSHKKSQEDRKQNMFKEQKARELKVLEGQLFYKQQEVVRLQGLFRKLKREDVLKQQSEIKEKQDVHADDRQIKEIEQRLKDLENEISRVKKDIQDKIKKEKAVIIEHQRTLDSLLSNSIKVNNEGQQKKRMLNESLSRLNFFKKREEHEATIATQAYNNHLVHKNSIEKSLLIFNQEVKVLENKIRSLNALLK